MDCPVKDIPEGFYLIGGGMPQNTRLLILGNEPQISIAGECKAFNKAKITNSGENRLYEDAVKKSDELARKI